MNIFDILPDPRLVDLFRAILESGGIIYGGCIRDLIRYGIFRSKDIDVYYDSSVFDRSIIFNRQFFNNLTKHIKATPSFNHIDHLHWIDSPVSDHGVRIDQFELGVPCKGFIKHHYLNEEVVVLDLIFRDGEFLNKIIPDVDINSLYLLPDGTISSSLGLDKVNSIISNIRNRKCRILRDSISPDRLHYILDKGYKCNLICFL